MKKYYLKQLDKSAMDELCRRPAVIGGAVTAVVQPILEAVRQRGDEALRDFSKKFDGIEVSDFEVGTDAGADVPVALKKAIETAAENIEKFHKAQVCSEISVETMPGVKCFIQERAIERVGIYIPGGSAPLFSTVLMLGIPAKIAGCREIVLCSPPELDPSILFAAGLVGIDKIYRVGGAQAIAAMAYGTETVPKVDKIFGPGNSYVTAAKMLVSTESVAIDMPAGPSEVLVIADNAARADFVAADLLSQAEHGADSQVVLVTTSEELADGVLTELVAQIELLPRRDIAEECLANSFVLLVENLDEAISFSNEYAPEHLILNIEDYEKYVEKIQNAGSVFLGPYSCESSGDYASGTNHCLPTSGFSKAYSGVSVDSFKKKIIFQEISREGAMNLGSTVELMAEAEGLEAHKNAMSLRIKS